MAKLPNKIYSEALQQWYENYKDFDWRKDCPFRYVEHHFRLQGYGKKKAFDWIVDLADLYGHKFDGAKIHFDYPPM